jgi:hypothetical protein
MYNSCILPDDLRSILVTQHSRRIPHQIDAYLLRFYVPHCQLRELAAFFLCPIQSLSLYFCLTREVVE